MQPTILYVEDEPENREIMRLLIEEMLGYTDLTIFENSRDFIKRLESVSPQPNVILLDIHVPPYDGFQMLQMLREHQDYREIPVAALTASVMNEEVAKLKQAGFDGVFAKPLDMDAFPTMLERIIKGEKIWHIMG